MCTCTRWDAIREPCVPVEDSLAGALHSLGLSNVRTAAGAPPGMEMLPFSSVMQPTSGLHVASTLLACLRIARSVTPGPIAA